MFLMISAVQFAFYFVFFFLLFVRKLVETWMCCGKIISILFYFAPDLVIFS